MACTLRSWSLSPASEKDEFTGNKMVSSVYCDRCLLAMLWEFAYYDAEGSPKDTDCEGGTYPSRNLSSAAFLDEEVAHEDQAAKYSQIDQHYQLRREQLNRARNERCLAEQFGAVVKHAIRGSA